MYTRFHTSIDVRPVTPSVYQGEQLRCSPPTYRLQNWYTNTVCMFWCLIFIEFFLYVNHISVISWRTALTVSICMNKAKYMRLENESFIKAFKNRCEQFTLRERKVLSKKIVLPNIYWKTIKVIAENFDERKKIWQALCPQLKEVLSILNSIY